MLTVTSGVRRTTLFARLLDDQRSPSCHGPSPLEPAPLQGYPSQVRPHSPFSPLTRADRTSAVCPGPVWTPLQPAAMDKEKMKTWHNSPGESLQLHDSIASTEQVSAPIGRIGQPSELGPAYVYLASQDASFVSGQSIHVNGGAVVNG